MINPAQSEEAEYFCDKHTDRRCYTQLQMMSWYGSIYDLTSMEIHLCDDCVLEMRKRLETEFNVKPKEITI